MSESPSKMLGQRSAPGDRRLQRYFMPEAFQSLDQVALEPFGVDLVKVAAAQLSVAFATRNEIVGNHQNGVPDSDDRALLASACGQPAVLSGKVGVLGVRRCPCCLA